MPNKVEWSNESMATLINMYRNRPCLWKLNHEHYTNKTIKHKMFAEIVDVLRADIPTVDVNMVKAKIQNMRSVYRKERKKIQQSERSVTPEEEVYKPSLWYYPLLDFTRDHDLPLDTFLYLDSGSTLDTSEATSISSPAEDELAGGGEGENKHVVPSDDEESTQLREEEIFKGPPPKAQKRSSKDGIEKDVSLFLKACTSALSAPSQPLDDCGALGTYVAHKLRKMDENQQMLAEALLIKVVTKGLRKRLTENTDIVD